MRIERLGRGRRERERGVEGGGREQAREGRVGGSK
jgi:hypothetical protein